MYLKLLTHKSSQQANALLFPVVRALQTSLKPKHWFLYHFVFPTSFSPDGPQHLPGRTVLHSGRCDCLPNCWHSFPIRVSKKKLYHSMQDGCLWRCGSNVFCLIGCLQSVTPNWERTTPCWRSGPALKQAGLLTGWRTPRDKIHSKTSEKHFTVASACGLIGFCFIFAFDCLWN